MNEYFTIKDEIKNIFINFNVSNQTEEMKNLNEKELYILLNACIESHSDEDPQVLQNFQSHIEMCKNLRKLFDTGSSDNETLLELSKQYGPFLSIPLQDKDGNDLPQPLTRNEVRELKLNNILEKK